MPPYPTMFEHDLDISTTMSKIHAMRKMGVPYPEGYEAEANNDLNKQAEVIANELREGKKIKIASNKEIIAMIAYLKMKNGRNNE